MYTTHLRTPICPPLTGIGPASIIDTASPVRSRKPSAIDLTNGAQWSSRLNQIRDRLNEYKKEHTVDIPRASLGAVCRP